jgi:hypothetical protein
MLEEDQACGATVERSGVPLSAVPHARGWFVHFYTGLLLGLLAIVLVAFLHRLPGITVLDRSGQDLVQRVYADGSHPAPAGVAPVVLLALNFFGTDPKQSEVGDIAKSITLLTRLKPRSIVIDQEFADTVAPDTMADFCAAIIELASPGFARNLGIRRRGGRRAFCWCPVVR